MPTKVPDQAGSVRGLELVVANTSAPMRIWNELMISEHPQGAGPLVGRQVRYLIASEHGWLGGFGFAAAALHPAGRDWRIGWDDERRRQYLHFVVGMSRFLLRPSIECRNLASKVLGLAITALPDDFQRQFGYRPWLAESFVDTSGYAGTRYQAANWIAVGRTKSRSRQDRFNQSALSAKAIYVYPLESDFQERMGLGPNAGLGALSPADGLEADQWAEHEFSDAPLGDARLSKRLVNVAAARAQVPGRAFSGVAKGDWPAVKGPYRMIDQPEDSAISMPNILAPHRRRTIRRMMGQKTFAWIEHHRDLVEVAAEMPQTRLSDVATGKRTSSSCSMNNANTLPSICWCAPCTIATSSRNLSSSSPLFIKRPFRAGFAFSSPGRAPGRRKANNRFDPRGPDAQPIWRYAIYAFNFLRRTTTPARSRLILG